ncbi:N-acetylglucosamine kinase-like BadF-type ATPase [Streptomyces sp. CG 926]|uniref:N-acetylglucosamine kinase n=1 Tax=Streptomyces sp. CG 926 TaxID=1882405 RepID=UPI000D6D044D|nr:BadF/BadG/BcrA/BcrD ATPase family protein [Streptomyces sp. CG 926]PWK63235.1 N-acetylglucosamine kinase-like BadF-type ATPase [Streptomyces sp. CG 926]
MGVTLLPVLAIDAGNSKTDVALIGPDGSVLCSGQAGGFQPPRTGVAAAVDVLAEAMADAGLRGGAGAGPWVEHVSAALANADFPVEEWQLAREIKRRGWGRTTTVRNDTFALLRAGLPAGADPCGVAVVCGAGINCVGMTPDGRTARFPAIGRISGDWGGGGGLAEEALWFAARAEDGRGGPTELARALPAYFDHASMASLIEAMHLGRVPHARRHELTPVLFAVAAAGDPVALSLVHRQADEVVAMASVALDRLDLLGREVPVVLGGSVLAAGHPQLNDRIAARLAERAPHARISVITAPPVLGAGLLGLDALGSSPLAYRKLRAHFG